MSSSSEGDRRDSTGSSLAAVLPDEGLSIALGRAGQSDSLDVDGERMGILAGGTGGDEAIGRPRLEAAAWLVAIVALVADVALTRYGLAIGAVEANPLARSLIESVGPAVAMGTLKLFGVIVALSTRGFLPEPYRFLAPVCLAGPWTVAALSNAVVVFVLL
jgi:hypothetical protein